MTDLCDRLMDCKRYPEPGIPPTEAFEELRCVLPADHIGPCSGEWTESD